MLNPAEKLLTITPAFADRQVAMMIAEKMIFYAKTEVYRYQINHDIRPPKCLRCPVRYDWAVKDHVGVEFKHKHLAVKWLTDALLHGYKAEEVDGNRKPTNARTESVEIARKRAENYQRPKPENDDDDIPF